MYLDARELPEYSPLEADVAIVGGGPAGITLARALAKSGAEILLVESGGLEPDAETQNLYHGQSVGIPYPLEGSRLRFLGGSSNHWGGYCLPLDEIDFEQRDWVPYSGWPISRDELAPYYAAASEIVEIAPARFDDAAYWEAETGEPLLPFPAGRLKHRFYQFSPPTRFGTRYGPELERQHNIRVVLHCNVTNIATGPAAEAVRHLDTRTLTGLSHRIHAKTYILATGGIENARLLLLSSDRVPSGLGNQHDLVGRFFMEHPHLGGFADVVLADPDRLATIYHDRILVKERPAQVAFVPTPDLLRRKRLLNASFTIALGEKYSGDETGDRASQHLDMLRAAAAIVSRGSEDLRPTGGTTIGARYGIGCACEQTPNPESRVTLSTQTDTLGLRRARLDWRLAEQDRRSVVEHMRSFAYEFGALGLGRIRLLVEDDGQWPDIVSGGSHHMGTTRMSHDPKTGVVDANCRVHGMSNLYVAGSSVFPTCGSANPTLTLVALAMRLADHLKSRPA
ncbi:MAG: GMC family oxidoreductase [Pseudomonadota bacterium]